MDPAHSEAYAARLVHPLTTASSSATLVEHFRQFQASPHPVPPLPLPTVARMANSVDRGSAAQGDADPAAWSLRLSASFGAIAEQITAASQALATIEVPTSVGHTSESGADALSSLSTRLDDIEQKQDRLGEDLEAIRIQLGRLQVNGREDHSGITVVSEGEADADGAVDLPKAVEELQKKVDGILETVKLDQARLYSRLQNAMITTNKAIVKPLVMANGKAPANFPGTKGEFEQMTKERYEHLLKSYNQPIKGDTAAKREAVREFLGLPAPSLK